MRHGIDMIECLPSLYISEKKIDDDGGGRGLNAGMSAGESVWNLVHIHMHTTMG